MYCSTVILILHETKLTATAEEEQQQLLTVLEHTKRMGYARHLHISMLESDGQLMLHTCQYHSDSLTSSWSASCNCTVDQLHTRNQQLLEGEWCQQQQQHSCY